MQSIFSRKAKAAFIACAWSSAAFAHSFTNHAGHVVSGKAYPLTVFPASEQARMRAIFGVVPQPKPREKAVSRYRKEMEKRREALEAALQ